MTKNPDFNGEWEQKTMKNPDYKGIWEAPMIKNPDYVDGSGDELYRYTDLKYVAFELWQVKSGTIFDNILVCDDKEYAIEFAKNTWGAMKDVEKQLYDDEKAKEEEEAQKRFEEEKALDAESKKKKKKSKDKDKDED